jgi:hypothetical protein
LFPHEKEERERMKVRVQVFSSSIDLLHTKEWWFVRLEKIFPHCDRPTTTAFHYEKERKKEKKKEKQKKKEKKKKERKKEREKEKRKKEIARKFIAWGIHQTLLSVDTWPMFNRLRSVFRSGFSSVLARPKEQNDP